MTDLPVIYAYLNYRLYLADVSKVLREKHGISVRSISKMFGFSSSSFLKRVTDGEKNILPESARRIGKALNISKEEIDFFVHLVHYNQAKNEKDRDDAFQKLLAFRRFAQTHKLSAQDYELWSVWYTTAILELVKTDLVYKGPAAMAEALGLAEEQVVHTLDLLTQLGFIQKKGSELRQLHPARETEPEVQSLTVRKYHEQMVGKALEALNSLPPTERSFSGLTVSLTKNEFDVFKRKLFETMKEVNALAGSDLGEKRVYQINFQIFPLSKEPAASTPVEDQQRKK